MQVFIQNGNLSLVQPFSLANTLEFLVIDPIPPCLHFEGQWFGEDAGKNDFGDVDEETEYERFLISIAVIVKLF